ncbi:MAG: hypothetical protein WCX64_03550 [Candidatus Micrarchaeia archaeon]
MKSALALFAVLALSFASFSAAETSQLGMQYATNTVLHDCAQKPLSITNRSEFLQFYSQPADESNIGKILVLAADLSTKDAAAVAAQQTYLQCGDYVLSAQNGTLYWRGVELTPPGYVRELEARVITLESQAAQSSVVQQSLQQRVSLLEADVLKARSDLSSFQFYCLGLMALILIIVAWQVFFNSKREGRPHQGIRHHVGKLLHRTRG